jgi:hypothetical protein
MSPTNVSNIFHPVLEIKQFGFEFEENVKENNQVDDFNWTSSKYRSLVHWNSNGEICV